MVEPANVRRLYPPVRSRVCVRMVAGPKLENWQVSRDQAITQLDPASGTPIGDEYIFDKVFVRESTKYLYDCLLKELIKEFCKKKQSAAVIIYGCSHTGKNECLLDTQKHDIGLLQSAFTDIVNYMAHEGDTYHLLRMSYVDVYREKVEDLLVTDLCSDTSVPKQGLQLTEDTSGYVVWLGAKEAVISSEKQLEYFYTIGHSEHVKRGHRTRGRLEAAHSIVRLILECLQSDIKGKTWDSMCASISYLDFVCVAGSELVPAFTGLVDELSRGPHLTRSLYALHHFVCHPKSSTSELYDSRQSTMTQLLREALVRKANSVFICVCDPADYQQTHATLRFGRAATHLVQHPHLLLSPRSKLHCIISKIIHKLDMVQPFYAETLKQKFDHIKNLLPHESMTFREVNDIFDEIKRVRQMIFPQKRNMSFRKGSLELYIISQKRRGRPNKFVSLLKGVLFKRKAVDKEYFIGSWHPVYPRETRRNHDCDDISERVCIMKNMISVCGHSKKHHRNDLARQMFGSIKMHDTSSYYGSYCEEPGIKDQKHNGNDFACLSTFLKGIFYVSKNGWICKKKFDYKFLLDIYELRNFEPKKVCFPLSKIKLCYPTQPCPMDVNFDYYIFLAWIQKHKAKLSASLMKTRPVYKMPDFIALKEVFKTMYLTPYHRTLHRWKMEAVMYEDGRVFIHSDRTLAEKTSNRSHEVVFNAFLRGSVLPGKEGCKYEAETMGCMAEMWQLFWGEVDGLGLFYGSKVDVVDKFANIFPHSRLKKRLKKILEPFELRFSMYKTHLHKAPLDTDYWREYQWNEFLGWWADYRFDKIPNILAGELKGDTVTALRLYSAPHLPKLAKVWCHKEAWDYTVCEKYLASLLRFIKLCCSKRPRHYFLFELQDNGDVSCHRKLSVYKNKDGQYCRLPKDFVKDMYPRFKKKNPIPKQRFTTKWISNPHIEICEKDISCRGQDLRKLYLKPQLPLSLQKEHLSVRNIFPYMNPLINTGRKRFLEQKKINHFDNHIGQLKRKQSVRDRVGHEIWQRKRKLMNEKDKQRHSIRENNLQETGDGRKKVKYEIDKQDGGQMQEDENLGSILMHKNMKENYPSAFYEKFFGIMAHNSKKGYQKKSSPSVVCTDSRTKNEQKKRDAFEHLEKMIEGLVYKTVKAQHGEVNFGTVCEDLCAKSEENVMKNKDEYAKILEDSSLKHKEDQHGEVIIDDDDIDLKAMYKLKEKLKAWSALATYLNKNNWLVHESSSSRMGQTSLVPDNVLECSKNTQQHIWEDSNKTDLRIYYDELSKIEENTLKMKERPVQGSDIACDNQEIMVKQLISESEEDESLHELWSSDE